MKKQVVMMINGFGIEQKNSYAIYDSFLMPNLDACTKEFFFSTLKNDAYDLQGALQKFSTGSDIHPNNEKLDGWLNEGIKMDPVIPKIKERFMNAKGNIHLFCMLSNDKTVKHVKEFLNMINGNHEKKIYLHVILDYPYVEDYKKLDGYLRNLKYDLNDTARLVTVTGRNYFENNNQNTVKEVVRLLYKNFGELWKQVSLKLEVLKKDNIRPLDTPIFCADTGFTLTDEDIVFLFNYDHVLCSDFIHLIGNPNIFMGVPKEFKNIKFLSLFPNDGFEAMYEEVPAKQYFTSHLEKFQKKALFVVEQEKIKDVNYLLNGFQNKIHPSLQYMAGNKEALKNESILKQIISQPYDIIFLNYFIDQSENINDLKETLKSVDQTVACLRKICEENDHCFWISSFYGMNKEMINEKKETVTVDFSSKVPIMFYDQNYLKRTYKLSQGSLYDFQITLFYMLEPNKKMISLVSKKGIFG